VRLICAAVIDELQPLLAAADFQQESELLFRHRGKPVLAAAFGVGLVDFTSGFQAFLQNFKINTALLTGTCGVYPEAEADWPIGTLAAPEKISLGDLSAVEKSGYLPPAITPSCVFTDKPFTDLGANIGGHGLTLTTITADDRVASRIANHYQAHFEQMEAYAFARLCQINQIHGSALFAVANRVGCDSHAQWLINARPGAGKAAELICQRFGL
jgi:nucleoside phosphorylase